MNMIIIQLLLGGFKFVKGNLQGGDMTIVKGQGTQYILLQLQSLISIFYTLSVQ